MATESEKAMPALTGPQTQMLRVLDRTWIKESRWREKSGYGGKHMAGAFTMARIALFNKELIEWRDGSFRVSAAAWSILRERGGSVERQ